MSQLDLMIQDVVRGLEDNQSMSDPVAWAKHKLKINLWQKQIEICESVMKYRYTIVASAYGCGKSYTAAILAAYFVDRYREDGWVVTTAPTESQVTTVLWQAIRRIARIGQLPGIVQLQDWKMGPKGNENHYVAIGRKPGDYNVEAFQGIHAPESVLVIFDEAPGIDKRLWDTARGLLASGNTHFLAIGNPTESSGPFYEAYQNSIKYPDEWNFIHINGFLTPNIEGIEYTDPPENETDKFAWKKKMLDELIKIRNRPEKIKGLVHPDYIIDALRSFDVNHPWFESKVFGWFPRHASNSIMPMLWIMASQKKWEEFISSNPELRGEAVIGVDPARFGGNETVIATRVDNVILRLQIYLNTDAVFIQGKIREEINHCSEEGLFVRNIRIDEPGLGQGIIDFMRKADPPFPPIIAVNTGRRPRNQSRFFNLRSELWWKVRERFDPKNSNSLMIPSDQKAEKQLIALLYEYTSHQQIKAESKDDLEERVGKGSEGADIGRADAIILAAAEDDWLLNLWEIGGSSNTQFRGPISIYSR
jgi:phage terminase large subunit